MQAPESYQVRPELFETFFFNPLTHQARPKTKTMPSKIGFPTLKSDASLKQKNNKGAVINYWGGRAGKFWGRAVFFWAPIWGGP